MEAQTIMVPLDQSFSLYAASLADAEQVLCQQVREGKLASERVYQICPLIGNPEAIRSVAINKEAKAHRVVLEAVVGMYSVFRSLRYADTKTTVEELSFARETISA